MTTNTYTNLCDSVGAYEEYGCGTYAKCQYKDDRPDVYCQNCNKDNLQRITYPPATAEQRERLEELIGDKWGSFEYIKDSNYVEEWHIILPIPSQPKVYCPNALGETRPDALYALTHKLVNEGVLGKEEVKEALCKNH